MCPRCDAVLAQGGRSMDSIFALILSGLLLWVSSLVLPILTLDVNGVQQPLSLWQTAFAMLDQEAWLLAILVAMTSFVAPFFIWR